MPEPKDGSVSREELMQLYLASIEDYHFQVNLTWSRTRFCLTLNAALLSVAAALFKLQSHIHKFLIIAVLSAGLLMTVFSILALNIGRKYYFEVTKRVRRLEQELSLGELGLRTTPEQGGPAQPLTVTAMLRGLLVLLGLIDLLGIGYVVVS